MSRLIHINRCALRSARKFGMLFPAYSRAATRAMSITSFGQENIRNNNETSQFGQSIGWSRLDDHISILGGSFTAPDYLWNQVRVKKGK